METSFSRIKGDSRGPTGGATGFRVEYLDRTEYHEALFYQRRLVRARQAGAIGDRLVLTEHEPVVTLGRGGDLSQLRIDAQALGRKGICFCRSDRGGGAAYHGPGQLVAYPVVDLRPERDIRLYLRRLEAAAIMTFEEMGVAAKRVVGLTGVWVGERKIAAVGIRVERWVTSHGIALNIAPDLTAYNWIHQCGLVGRGATSVKAAGGRETTLDRAAALFAESFGSVFGWGGPT